MSRKRKLGSKRRHKVRVTSSCGKVSSGEVCIQHWTQQERIIRAIKSLLFCWALAVVAVLIPLLHLILVPSLLIAGPILAYFMMQQQSIVLGGEGICPDCKADLAIVRSSDKWPLSDLCSHCRTAVQIERLGDSSE